MLNPDKMLRLTVISNASQEQEYILELDPERVVGWLEFENSTLIYTDVEGHNTFTVKEKVEKIKELMKELKEDRLE